MKRRTLLALGSGVAIASSLLVAAPGYSAVAAPATATAQASVGTTLSAYDDAVLADQPSVYWTMASASSGAEPDLGSAGLTASYTGSPAATQLPNGDTATAFDGATQYLEAADADALSPTTTGEITIEAWIRPDTLQFANSQSSGYVNWMGKGEDQQHEYLGRMYSLTNTENRPNRISGYSFNNTGGLGAGSYFQDPVSVGEWIHYALVINTNDKGGAFPNGYTKVYKNGVLRDQDDLSIRGVTIIPERSSAPFRAGTRDFASWFEGAIGKIAIYDTELTPQQLAAHTEAMLTTSTWDAAAVYGAGDEVSSDGRTYVAQWWTANQAPGDPWGPWAERGARTPAAGEDVRVWTASSIYTGGEVVAHDGHTWRAQWWTRNQEPGDPSGPWADLGGY